MPEDVVPVPAFALRGMGNPPIPMTTQQEYICLKNCPSCDGRGWFLINPFATIPPPCGGIHNKTACLTCIDAHAYWKAHGELPPELVKLIEEKEKEGKNVGEA